MYLNLLLFFMCSNLGLGIMHIPDTPLSVPESFGQCFAEFEESPGDGKMVPIGELDSRGIDPNDPGFSDIRGELEQPTNSTSTQQPGDPTGGGEPFNQITEAIEASYKTMETMKNFVSGGYVMNVLANLNMECDTQPTLLTLAECQANPPAGWNGSTVPCDNPNFGQPVPNVVWDYFSTSFQVVVSFLVVVTLFYFITGRGTFLSN